MLLYNARLYKVYHLFVFKRLISATYKCNVSILTGYMLFECAEGTPHEIVHLKIPLFALLASFPI